MKITTMRNTAAFFCVAMLAISSAWAGPKVKIATNQGVIILELNPEKAPKTVENFLQYANDGSYSNSIFHRVIKDFMIQGGGFGTNSKKLDTHAPVANESKNGLQNKRGSIAMARTNMPHSATRQFFINHKDNSFLNGGSNWGYTVFGEVIEGMAVVDKIANTETGRDAKLGMKDVPKTPVIITSVSIYDPVKEAAEKAKSEAEVKQEKSVKSTTIEADKVK